MKIKKLLSVLLAAATIAATAGFTVKQADEFDSSVHEAAVTEYLASKSKIKTVNMYVTGVEKDIVMKDSDGKKAKPLVKIKLKAQVQMIDDSSETCYYVYSKADDEYGYIKKEYLTKEKNAVCKRTNAYTSKKTNLYETNGSKPKKIDTLAKNSPIFIVSKNSGDYWFVYDKKGKEFGYIKSLDITTTKASTSRTSSKTTTKTTTNNSTNRSGSLSGSYSTWTVFGTNSANGHYLALRSAPATNAANEIGKLWDGQTVQVYSNSYSNYSDTFWYVYAPSLGLWGYVNSNYITSGSTYTAPSNNSSSGYTTWRVANTNSAGGHYLALRSAPATNSANEIGKLWDGDTVRVYSYSYSDFTDTFWYVYAPTLGQWGYINSNYIWQV